MSLHLYNDGEKQELPADSRVLNHVEYALAIGEGGSAAWKKLDESANLTALEAELQTLGIELQKCRAGFAELSQDLSTAHERRAELQEDMQHIECCLELHIWRRCLHLAQRLGAPDARPSADTVERFTTVVLTMQSLLAKTDRQTEGHIAVAGIAVRAETTERITQLFSLRAEPPVPADLSSVSHEQHRDRVGRVQAI